MKIDTDLRTDHQVNLTVEVEPDVLESAKRRAARQIARQVKIPGFRPGKAPYNVVEKHVGEAAILEDALDLLIEDVYPKVIEEADIQPYGPGSLEEVVGLDPPTFKFTVPLAPEVTLQDYRQIRIPYELQEVTGGDVNEVLEDLRDQQAVISPVERPVEEGDLVYIVLTGKRKEADDEEKSSTLIEERRLPVVVESEETDASGEWPFPGFSRTLIGLSAGDEKTQEYTFPEEDDYEDLQGVIAEFNIKVEGVKSRTLPDLDDDFARSVSDHESLDELRESIRASLAERNQAQQNAEYESEVIDKISQDAQIKYPPQMLEHEIDHFIQDLSRRLANQGLDIEMYLKSREMEIEALREEVKPSAEERLIRSLVLMEIANAEDISVSQEEVEQQTQETLNELRQVLPEEEVQKLVSGDGMQGLVSRIISDRITSRTLERLRAIAKGEAPKEEAPQESEQVQTEQRAEKAAAEES